MRILGCHILKDFIYSQTDRTYMQNLNGLLLYTFLRKLFHCGRKLKHILNRVNGGCVINFKMDRCWLDIQFGNYVSGLELVAAYADGHVKIYESLDTLELKR